MTTYKQAGVNIDAGNELVRIIRKTAPSIGGFSGLYPLEKTNLLLSATTDGVGTKLKLAFLLDKHDTVGIDLVAMSVNDLICCGAKPLLFLDYFATSRLDLKVAGAVIKGINEGCKQAGCLLIGGETAEMPGFYKKGEYDLSGFAVGTVERGKVIDGSKIKPGDVVIGLPSSGLHSNGFSMVHKVLSRGDLKKYGKTLIAPTRIYVKKVLGLLSRYKGIKGVANVTGGAFYEKIARVLPSNCDIVIDKNSWKPQEIFNILKRKGNIADKELYRVFNMGIGMALIVDKSFADKVRRSSGDGIIIGEVVRGSKSVKIV
jgi:phosphoribosylformylglycinamidine cyclo-ligase